MTDKPSYIGGGATSSPQRPSYLGGMNGADDGRIKPKMKTMAAQTGELSARERLNDGVPQDGGLPNDSHTDPKDREVQPAGFQPNPFLRQRIESFLENPNVKNGYRLYNRVVFETVDTPIIDISEAYGQRYTPTIVLGTEKERSTTRLAMKFAIPSPDTALKGLEAILTALSEWEEGAEKYGKDKNYLPKVYVYGTYDYPEEVMVVIA